MNRAKFVLTLSFDNREFFYSIDYSSVGCKKSFSKYFAAAHFFDSPQSVEAEVKTIHKQELKSIIKLLCSQHKITEPEPHLVKIFIKKVTTEVVIELTSPQTTLFI